MSFDDRIRQSLEDRAARAEVSDDAWAAISARTGRRRRPRLGLALAGAALPVAVALAVVVAVDGGPEVVTEAGPASGDGATDDGSEGTASAYDHTQPGGVDKAGPGEVVAVSLDGSALIVADFDGRTETGCEGLPEPILLRAPFDGSRREPVGVDPDGKPLSGSLVRGPHDQVAVLDICEGFLGRILLGHENPDGTFDDLAEFHHPLPSEAYVTGWSASGQELLAIAWVDDGEPRRAAVRVDVATGEMQEIIRGEINDVGELREGSFVVAGDDGSVHAIDARGGTQWSAPGESFAISPDRRTIAVAGPKGIELFPVDETGTHVTDIPPGHRVNYMDWAESGETLAYILEPADTTDTPVSSEVYVVGPGAGKPVRLSDEVARYGGAVFSPTGDLLAWTRYQYDPDFSAETLVARFPRR